MIDKMVTPVRCDHPDCDETIYMFEMQLLQVSLEGRGWSTSGSRHYCRDHAAMSTLLALRERWERGEHERLVEKWDEHRETLIVVCRSVDNYTIYRYFHSGLTGWSVSKDYEGRAQGAWDYALAMNL